MIYVNLHTPLLYSIKDYKEIERILKEDGFYISDNTLKYIDEIYFLLFDDDKFLIEIFDDSKRYLDEDDDEYTFDADFQGFIDWIEADYDTDDFVEYKVALNNIFIGELL